MARIASRDASARAGLAYEHAEIVRLSRSIERLESSIIQIAITASSTAASAAANAAMVQGSQNIGFTLPIERVMSALANLGI